MSETKTTTCGCTETSRAPGSQRGLTIPPDKLGATVSVTIDEQKVAVPYGSTILEAAKQIGVHIPTLCYHPDLCVAGICRICSVEVDGMRTLQTACAYPITESMTIRTHTRKI